MPRVMKISSDSELFLLDPPEPAFFRGDDCVAWDASTARTGRFHTGEGAVRSNITAQHSRLLNFAEFTFHALRGRANRLATFRT
jgi:hypothetical protein